MRVPKEMVGRENIELGVEFKNTEFGSLITSTKITDLKFSKPPLQDFFKGLSSESMVRDIPQVIKCYEAAAEYYNDDANFLNSYAWMLVMVKDKAQRKPKKAVELAEKAVKLSEGMPMYGNILDTLAVAYYQNDQLEKAVETIEKALPLAGDQKDVSTRAAHYKNELKEKQTKATDKPGVEK